MPPCFLLFVSCPLAGTNLLKPLLMPSHDLDAAARKR